MMKGGSSFLHRFSWALFDFGNSAFAAIVQTFLFAQYFIEQIAQNSVSGGVQWGWMNGIAGLLIAVLGPILGAIADQSGHRKIWIGFFTLLCVIPTMLLSTVFPGQSSVSWALLLVGLGTIGSELAFVFYNALLPTLVTSDQIGRWSSWGWAFGYLGGFSCMLLVGMTESTQFSFVIAGVWILLFALPLLIFVPDVRGQGFSNSIGYGLGQLSSTFREVRNYRGIVIFLVARLFYMNALSTLFVFAGIYASGEFGLSFAEMVKFGLFLHLSSAAGCVLFSLLDDWIGSRLVILACLVGLIFTGLIVFTTHEIQLFFNAGIVLGVFVGPLQASSRSLMARLTPSSLMNEMFGFYAVSGKATAFLGPILVAVLIDWTGSLRLGLSVLLLLFAIGAVLMTSKELSYKE